MMPPHDEDVRARVALSRLFEPANAELGALVRERGAAKVLAQLRAVDLDNAKLQASARSRINGLDVDAELAGLDAVDGRIVCPGDAEWPVCLDDLGNRAPLLLWVRGAAHLASAADEAVAMVGTRAPSAYGVEVATAMATELGDRGWTVVSGGAYGIDAAAHRGALAAGGTTIAVLACGFDVTYPRGHEGLFAAVRESGAVVSELPPGSAPHRMRFLDRNRLIAALGAGTVVVEAASRSGARRTATEARDLGRSLMVVPGPVTATESVGCHRILREEPASVLVTSAADVLEVVGRIGLDLAPVPRAPVHRRDGLSPDVARVLDAVPVLRAQGPARIAATAGLPLQVVERGLGLLQLSGLVEARGAGYRLARNEPDKPPRASMLDPI
jgi:DNA processing protein